MLQLQCTRLTIAKQAGRKTSAIACRTRCLSSKQSCALDLTCLVQTAGKRKAILLTGEVNTETLLLHMHFMTAHLLANGPVVLMGLRITGARYDFR